MRPYMLLPELQRRFACFTLLRLVGFNGQLKLEKIPEACSEDGVCSRRTPDSGSAIQFCEDAVLRFIISNPNHVLSGMMPATATRKYNLVIFYRCYVMCFVIVIISINKYE